MGLAGERAGPDRLWPDGRRDARRLAGARPAGRPGLDRRAAARRRGSAASASTSTRRCRRAGRRGDVAVKPQLMHEALPTLAPMAAAGTLMVSVVAGVPMARFEALAPGTPVVRAMPNTPAAIGRGISALVANAAAGEAGLARAEALMSAVGETVRLADEGADGRGHGALGLGPGLRLPPDRGDGGGGRGRGAGARPGAAGWRGRRWRGRARWPWRAARRRARCARR